MSVSAYLDHNAGTPARPEVVSAMAEVLALPGNPSSVHGFGRDKRRLLEEARGRVAALVGAEPAGVVFTSGGTEANALALRGTGRRVLVSAVEHASVLDACPNAVQVPVGGDGLIKLKELERLLSESHQPAMVSVMFANNETGILQPVSEVVQIARARGALVHCDAAQAPGRVELSLFRLGPDLLTLSAHKLGGPPGVGALVLADPERELAPILLGGGQERRRRAGTENLPGIVGFGVAAMLAASEPGAAERMKELRDRLEAEAVVRVPGALVVGQGSPRLPNTSCLALPGVASQTQVMALDLAGVAVSAGAACSSGKVAASRVLQAMGLGPDIAGSAIRVSLGAGTRDEEIERFLVAWAALAERKGFKGSRAA